MQLSVWVSYRATVVFDVVQRKNSATSGDMSRGLMEVCLCLGGIYCLRSDLNETTIKDNDSYRTTRNPIAEGSNVLLGIVL
jgi:hypothetical protein